MRKIAAHYYLHPNGTFVKYPILTIENGIITDISSFDSLPELASLEFYSGILLPLFVDVISCSKIKSLSLHPSVLSPLISKIIIPIGCSCSIPMLNRFHEVELEKYLICGNEIDQLSILNKIDNLIVSGQFVNQVEGVVYFTSFLSNLFGLSNISKISVGCVAELVLCSDLNLVKLEMVEDNKFSRLI